MAVPVGFPLDSEVLAIGSNGLPIYSNQYTSADYRRVISKFFKNGVFDNGSLSVLPTQGQSGVLSVIVGEGSAVVNGAIFTNPSVTTKSVAITPPEGTSAYLYVRVVVRLDTSGASEKMSIEILKGEYQPSETFVDYPALTRNESVYEICLAQLKFLVTNTNANYMTITDTRLDPALCGLATPYVQFDTTAFSTELDLVVEETDTRAKELLANINSEADAAMENLEEKTNTAVQLAADALDETVAGSIYNRLEDLETDVRPISLGGTGGSSALDAANELMVPSLATGNIIPTGANLNDYTQPGNYVLQSTSQISTIQNVPSFITHGFHLMVIAPISSTGQNLQAEHKNQLIFDYQTGAIGMRWFNVGTSSWSSWIQYISTNSSKSIASNMLDDDLNELISNSQMYNNYITITCEKFSSVNITSFLKFGSAYIANITFTAAVDIPVESGFSFVLSEIADKPVRRCFILNDMFAGYGVNNIWVTTNAPIPAGKRSTFGLLMFAK